MVDYELFEKILSKKEDGYINYGDFINYKTVMLFVKSRADDVKKLFAKKKKEDCNFYLVELKCPKCGELYNKKVSRYEIYKVLSSIRSKAFDKSICDKCIAEKKRKETEYKIAEEYRKQKQIEKDTERYISLYLDSDKCWNKGVSNKRKLYDLHTNVKNDTIIEYIKEMDYQDFLNTPYWKAISEAVKIKAGYRCQLCNSNIGLNTHHRCYDNHGDELHNMQDLICFCEECHNNHHNNK